MNRETSRGVSPVVAVILLVAVTVTLSAVIGGFALNLGQSSTSSTGTGEVATTVDRNADGTATVQAVSIGSATSRVIVSNDSVSTNLTSVGETVTLDASNESITVVAVTDGERTVVNSYDTAESTVSGSSGDGVTFLSDGLAHRWTASNSSSSALVDEVAGLNGTEVNATYTTVDGVEAIAFDGSSTSGIDEFSSGDIYAENMTISFWVKPSSVPSSGEKTLLWYGESGTTKDSYGLTMQSDRWRFSTQDSTGTSFNEYGGTPTAGAWHHIVLVGNQTQMTGYVNGTVVAENASFSGGFIAYSGNEAILGAYDDLDGYHIENLNGYVHDFRMYDRDLNHSEVQEVYENGR